MSSLIELLQMVASEVESAYKILKYLNYNALGNSQPIKISECVQPLPTSYI